MCWTAKDSASSTRKVGQAGGVVARSALEGVEEGEEGVAVCEGRAEAVAPLVARGDVRGTDGVAGDGADLGLPVGQEIDDVEKVGHKTAILAECLWAKKGNILQARRALHGNFQGRAVLFCREVKTLRSRVSGDALDVEAAEREVLAGSKNSVVVEVFGFRPHIGHARKRSAPGFKKR